MDRKSEIDKKSAASGELALFITIALTLLVASSAPPGAGAQHSNDGKAEKLSFETMSDGAGIVGLNYAIGAHGYPVVSDLYKEGPAVKAGIKIGDEILSVGNEDTRYIGYLHLQHILTGEKGTSISLKIKNAAGASRVLSVERAAVESFKDPNLTKYKVAKWSRSEATKKREEQTSGRTPVSQAFGGAEHNQDDLVDLPFALLAREHNKPTLFELVEKESDPGVSHLLKEHSDGAYISGHCRIVRITNADEEYTSLCKYFGLAGGYALIPIYQPWLVTVKASDILTAIPSQSQLNGIAAGLIHNSIKVQVSHAVSQEKNPGGPDRKLNKRPGLSHRSVLKRLYQALPAGNGIIGLGFAAGSDGYAAITQIFAGGPADRAGLKKGDKIVEVNGLDTRYLGLEHIQEAFTGPVGQSVAVQISNQGAPIENTSERVGARKVVRKVVLKFEPINTFREAGLNNLTIAKWQNVISSNADDSNEYELPCCMIAAAQDKLTLFEFCRSENAASAAATIAKLKVSGNPAKPKVQVVKYTPTSKDYEALRKYFQITGDYVCLPIYYLGKHKTVKAGEFQSQVPSEKELTEQIEQIIPPASEHAGSAN